jgi:hypothetical protein
VFTSNDEHARVLFWKSDDARRKQFGLLFLLLAGYVATKNVHITRKGTFR